MQTIKKMNYLRIRRLCNPQITHYQVIGRLICSTLCEAVFDWLKELTRTLLSCAFILTISFKSQVSTVMHGNVIQAVDFL